MQYSSSKTLPDFYPPKRIWILGAGKFGRIAVERLHKRYADARFLIIDRDEEKLNGIRNDFSLPIRVEDAVPFIVKTQLPEDAWIIPAVPVHMAFLWLLWSLKQSVNARAVPVPETVDGQVPNPQRVESGTVYTSFATFLCPDFCSEPDEICTYTKAPRPGNLFDLLAKVQAAGFDVVVMRSLQLAPGVGGYPGSHLWWLLDRVGQKEGSYLIATSCRCHGVIDALRWNP